MREALIQTNHLPSHSGDRLTLTVIPATREVAEPFLELSVGLDSLHRRLARLLAARGSDNMGFEAPGRAVGRGNTKKGSPTWLPSSQTHHSPPPYPVQKTEKCQKNLPGTSDFGQSLNDKRAQETAEKLLPLLKPKYKPPAGSFQR